LDAASKNDKDFLGQLIVKKGVLYVFDKSYMNYKVYQKWTNQGVYLVARVNENASYSIVKENPVDIVDLSQGVGILKDQHIKVKINGSKDFLVLLLGTYKDPESGKVLKFLIDHFDYQAMTIAMIYKNRWAIEPFFKQLKQNYQLNYFSRIANREL